MNRRFYFVGIYILGLYVAADLFLNILHFRFGEQIYSFRAFGDWFGPSYVIFLLHSFVLLIYYRAKKYRFSYWTALVFTLATLYQFFVVKDMLRAGDLAKFFSITYFLSLGTGMLYAVSLVFSRSGERPWLNRAGKLLLFVGLALLSTDLWRMHPGNAQVVVLILRIRYWIALVNDLAIFLFAINFYSELRMVRTKSAGEEGGMDALNLLFLMIGAGGLVLLSVFGFRLANARPGPAGDADRITEKTRRLAEPFEARVFVNHRGDSLRYRLMMPLGYDPQKKYPLAVCLHHGGAHGTDNILQIDGSGAAQMLSTAPYRSQYPAILFVPQCPAMTSWAAIDGLLLETIHSLEATLAIDSDRIYVTGVSGGGYGSWNLICAHPNLFAAAIPVCGAGDPSLAQRIIHIPIWAFQGEEDAYVPARLPREMIAAIRKAGGHPLYTEFPGEGHNIWDHVSQTPGLLDWLFAQKRGRRGV